MGIKDSDEKLVVAVMPGKFTIEAGSMVLSPLVCLAIFL